MTSVELSSGIRDDQWKDSFDSYDALRVGRGSSGSVFAIDRLRVYKQFDNCEDGDLDFQREMEIYEVLQKETQSPHIVHFVETFNCGLVLERHETSLRSHLISRSDIPAAQRLNWVEDMCKALIFLHKKEIMHGDVGCHNLLISKENSVKLCDFAGSKRDGEMARVCYEVRGQHPKYLVANPTITTEIFALGSTIYEIYTSRPPYAEETDMAVRKLFRSGDFPVQDIESHLLRQIVHKCWKGGYDGVSSVCKDLHEAKHEIRGVVK